MTDGYPMLLGTLKDLDSNVRSEISYLDRNLINNGNTNTAAIVQNSATIGSQGRDTTLRSAILNDMGRIKSDLEKQAAEHSALSARDMALLSRDILSSRGDMRQASENTASIQLESMKNKDCLHSAIHSTYDKLSALNTDRIRDNLNDYRAEATGLKYGDEYGRRHDIHNNLYSNFGRDRERDGFPGRH